MRFIFFGTPHIAGQVLEALINANHAPVLLISNPDRPQGRKKIITPPPTKLIAEHDRIPVFQPESLKDETVQKYIKNINADYAIVCAYSKIIPLSVLSLFPKGVIGVHPSLLPKYRGASPIQSVILNSEIETGVTLYMMDEKVDHGAILTQSKVQIAQNDTTETLSQKLGTTAGKLLAETIPLFEQDKITPKEQNHSEATFTKKFTNEDGLVDLEKDNPIVILNKVRALNPEPGVYTIQNGKRMKILEGEMKEDKFILKKIQWESKTPQTL